MAVEARYRVLLVSDDEQERATVSEALRTHDIRADCACDAGTAVSMSCQEGYDAILIDCGRSGTEIIASLRKCHVDSPVLMIIKGGQSEMAANAIKGVLSGAFDCISREPGYIERLPMLIESNAGKYYAQRLKGELQEEVSRLTYVVESVEECVALTDRWGGIIYTNRTFDEKFGYAKGELAGADIRIAFEDGTITGIIRDLKHSSCDGGWSGELRAVSRGGKPIQSLVTLTARRNAKGDIRSYMVLIRDITEMKRLEEGLQRKLTALTRPEDDLSSLHAEELFDLAGLQRLQDTMAGAMGVSSIIVRLDGEPLTAESNYTRLCTFVSAGTENGREYCRMCYRELGEAVASGMPAQKTCRCTGMAETGLPLIIEGRTVACWIVGQVALEKPETDRVVSFIRGLGGAEERVPGLLLGVPAMTGREFGRITDAFRSVAGHVSELAARNLQQARVIAERDRAMRELQLSEERFRHMSLRDALTGLCNRARFEQEIARLDNGRHGPVSVIAVDVDDLKVVNDTMGHKAGDDLLVAVAAVLRDSFGEGIVSRVGGDEFCIILEGDDTESAEMKRLRLLDNIASRNRMRRGPLISVSVGLATSREGESIVQTYQRADDSMYAHKRGSPRGTWR